MGERIKVPIPVFAADHTGFDAYMKEVRAWRRLCGLPKEDQGVMLWMQLPREHASDIKAKIEAEIGFNDLEKEDRAKKSSKPWRTLSDRQRSCMCSKCIENSSKK